MKTAAAIGSSESFIAGQLDLHFCADDIFLFVRGDRSREDAEVLSFSSLAKLGLYPGEVGGSAAGCHALQKIACEQLCRHVANAELNVSGAEGALSFGGCDSDRVGTFAAVADGEAETHGPLRFALDRECLTGSGGVDDSTAALLACFRPDGGVDSSLVNGRDCLDLSDPTGEVGEIEVSFFIECDFDRGIDLSTRCGASVTGETGRASARDGGDDVRDSIDFSNHSGSLITEKVVVCIVEDQATAVIELGCAGVVSVASVGLRSIAYYGRHDTGDSIDATYSSQFTNVDISLAVGRSRKGLKGLGIDRGPSISRGRLCAITE